MDNEPDTAEDAIQEPGQGHLSDNDSDDDFRGQVAMETDYRTIKEYHTVRPQLADDTTVRDLAVEGSFQQLYCLPDLNTQSQQKSSVMYMCSTCGKRFVSKGGLKFHEKHYHTEGKLYCLLCKKPFKLSIDLERHMNIHSGNRPYKCSQCDKAFVCKSSLSQHEKLKHIVGHIYCCDICDKTFNTESDLNRHNRVHTGDKPFICEQCPKSFTCKSSLNVHKRTHDGKAFKCSFCKMQFYIKSDLKRHETRHTGDKPFKCDICFNSYSCKSSYKVHYRNTHALTSLSKEIESQVDKILTPERVKVTFKIQQASVETPATEISPIETSDDLEAKELNIVDNEQV